MCEPVETFSKALEEQGLDAKITHESLENSHEFHATKSVGNNTITITTSIDANYIGSYSTKKRIAIAARGVADAFEEKLTDKFPYNGKTFQVTLFDEPEVRCLSCDSTTTIPQHHKMFQQNAEISLPQPRPVEKKTVIGSLDSHSRISLKLYLLGKLSDECDCSGDRKI